MPVNCLVFHFPGLESVTCAFQLAPMAAAPGEMEDYLRPHGLEAIARRKQVHGDALDFEPQALQPGSRPTEEADGMACQSPGLGLAINTADCQPVLLAHRAGRFVAALHVGWRGNRCNFPASAVARLCAHYQCQPEELLAVRGPSLGPDKAEFVNFDAEWGEEFLPWLDRKSMTMDLWGLTRAQLLAAGLRGRNIHGIDLCTASNPALFCSWRRNRDQGRQSNLIWIRRQTA